MPLHHAPGLRRFPLPPTTASSGQHAPVSGSHSLVRVQHVSARDGSSLPLLLFLAIYSCSLHPGLLFQCVVFMLRRVGLSALPSVAILRPAIHRYYCFVGFFDVFYFSMYFYFPYVLQLLYFELVWQRSFSFLTYLKNN
jgi:hypothetical protein